MVTQNNNGGLLITDPNYLIPMEDTFPLQQEPSGPLPSDYDWVTKPFGIPPTPQIIPQLPYIPGPPQPDPGRKGPPWWNFWSGMSGQQRSMPQGGIGGPKDSTLPYELFPFMPTQENLFPFAPKPKPRPTGPTYPYTTPGSVPLTPRGPMEQKPPWWQFFRSGGSDQNQGGSFYSEFRKLKNRRQAEQQMQSGQMQAPTAARTAPKKQAKTMGPRDRLSGVSLRGTQGTRRGAAGRRPM